ncbi:MAG: universal stress protein [Myxococcota bacterium]|nr:universal stress protein [Myxococcota bacterium]
MSPASVPFVEKIFHPTDFSEQSAAAFAHALAICLFRQGELTILHAGQDYLDGDDWQKFPHVRRTLERWKLLEPGSSKAAVFRELGIRVNKVSAVGTPLEASLDYLADNPADLMVLGTEAREGLPRFLKTSTAEDLARHSGIPTLFVPQGARGFIDADGELTLKKILVPVDVEPDPTAALVYAGRATMLSGGDPVELVVQHVGDAMPALELPPTDVEGCTWRQELTPGVPDAQILALAEREQPGLIFMATAGPDGITEVLRGSTTERVLRRSPCPLCAVPPH